MTVQRPVGSPPQALALGAQGSSMRHASPATHAAPTRTVTFIAHRFGENPGSGKQVARARPDPSPQPSPLSRGEGERSDRGRALRLAPRKRGEAGAEGDG